MKTRARVQGYTLAELVIVLIIVAILAAVAIPTIGNMMTNAKISSSEKEMTELARALVGDADKELLGFVDEVGKWPAALTALYAIGSESPYNPFTRTGWNGPYIDLRKKDVDRDGSIGATEYDVLYDAWGNAYDYDDTAKTITSYGSDGAAGGSGSAADIVINIEN